MIEPNQLDDCIHSQVGEMMIGSLIQNKAEHI